jgi:NADH dehydrogenase FAD-containing subunit
MISSIYTKSSFYSGYTCERKIRLSYQIGIFTCKGGASDLTETDPELDTKEQFPYLSKEVKVFPLNSWKNGEQFMAEKTVGSVVVVGGGIAGMQASLDLADSGYLVHLIEASSAIGGVMSELDKTFPTNDCSM